MTTWVVDVGWTSVRPVVVDQYRSRVTVVADTALEAEWVATALVAGVRASRWRPPCEMVTSSQVLV